MDAKTGEVALDEQLVQFRGPSDGVDEDHELVELEGIQQIDELPVLLVLLESHVVLLQSVECELRSLVDVDLQRLER